LKILLTGVAGFIGFHLAEYLLKESYEVIGFDSVNDYYEPGLKWNRLKELGIYENIVDRELVQSVTYPSFRFIRMQLEDEAGIMDLFEKENFDIVVNLAAQAGVRYSLDFPKTFINSNITGFLNILEACRSYPVKHLVYASSSSVYGLNTSMPFSTSHRVDHPISLYAASKKSNELMAHSYSHLFGIPTTGLRFFTVYGPWGRPDMALFLFTEAIKKGKPIDVFNNGNMERDFTYISDIVEGISLVMKNPPQPDKNWQAESADIASSSAPYRIFNIGNNQPIKLMSFIEEIENQLDKKAILHLLPMQPGDVLATFSDISPLQKLGFQPKIDYKKGIFEFVKWYNSYYK
jgi:UDP-glucuronate 4-epimerase